MMWTNKEIVNHLRHFPGEIHTESLPLPAGNRFRVENKFILKKVPFDPEHGNLNGGMAEVEEDQYLPPPFNLSLYKGIKSYQFPREFVTFLLTHPVARDYIDWVMFTANAEEHTVATLARISNITLNHNGTWQVTQNREPQVQNLLVESNSSTHQHMSVCLSCFCIVPEPSNPPFLLCMLSLSSSTLRLKII